MALIFSTATLQADLRELARTGAHLGKHRATKQAAFLSSKTLRLLDAQAQNQHTQQLAVIKGSNYEVAA